MSVATTTEVSTKRDCNISIDIGLHMDIMQPYQPPPVQVQYAERLQTLCTRVPSYNGRDMSNGK